ncbi:MAG: TRAP transporter large permease subunit [Microbacterium gubbeenense]|uniref:TRAP transporter large permease subunit n=1 Tax=Microbacterium gubbeenense TaxID=159896 RepID=UPI003F959483
MCSRIGERVHATAADRLAQVRHILPVVVLIAAVLGGIYSGVTTVTEASALGALGALVLALIYRGLTWRSLFEALKRTVWVTAMIMAIVIGANILSFGLATTGAARALTAWVTASAPSVGVFLLLVFVLLFVLGMFMEGLSMMMLTMPILFPLLQAYDVNMVWFGVVLVVLIEVGLITPPVGMNLFVLQGVTGEKISTIARGAVPYLIIILAFVGLLWAFPAIAMWLPNAMAS